jgi:hypothetical protein
MASRSRLAFTAAGLLIALILAVAVGVATGSLRLSSGGDEPGKAIQLQAGPISVGAETLTIRADDLEFTQAGSAGTIVTYSDQGLPHLTAEWQEHGRPMALQIGFDPIGAHWRIGRLRSLDGSATNADWGLFPPQALADTAIGSAWFGDIEAEGQGREGVVVVEIRGAVVLYGPTDTRFAAPPGGGTALSQDARPFDTGGDLYCSGILQMAPGQAHAALLSLGYRVKWRLMTNGHDSDQFLTEPPAGVIPNVEQNGVRAIGVSNEGALVIPVVPPDSPRAAEPAVRPFDCPGS